MTGELTEGAIDAMPAGREMDALIAEVVMGWTGVQQDAYTPYGKDCCGTPPKGSPLTFPETGRAVVPHYSEDIRAAWQVSEKVAVEYPEGSFDYGPWWTVEGPTPSQSGWFAGWKYGVQWEGESDLIGAAGETAPLAICRAALLASMKETR